MCLAPQEKQYHNMLENIAGNTSTLIGSLGYPMAQGFFCVSHLRLLSSCISMGKDQDLFGATTCGHLSSEPRHPFFSQPLQQVHFSHRSFSNSHLGHLQRSRSFAICNGRMQFLMVFAKMLLCSAIENHQREVVVFAVNRVWDIPDCHCLQMRVMSH